MFRATGSILSTMWMASAAAVTGTMLTKSCNSTLHSPLPCLLNHFLVKPTNVLQKVEKSRSWASCGSSSISVAHLFCTSWPSTSASPRRRLLVRAARIESKAVPLASRAPDFELPEPLTGKVWKLDDFEGYPALLVMFICNHCPFVKHLKKDIVKLANEYMQKGLAVIAISSNSVITHPEDGPDLMAEEAKQFEFPFPYLYDQTQEVARAFGAACTPDFFLFKKDGRRPFELVYHGQFDDSRPNNNKPITGRDLRLALDCVLSGRPLSSTQQPSVGCSIKWHPKSTP